MQERLFMFNVVNRLATMGLAPNSATERALEVFW